MLIFHFQKTLLEKIFQLNKQPFFLDAVMKICFTLNWKVHWFFSSSFLMRKLSLLFLHYFCFFELLTVFLFFYFLGFKDKL